MRSIFFLFEDICLFLLIILSFTLFTLLVDIIHALRRTIIYQSIVSDSNNTVFICSMHNYADTQYLIILYNGYSSMLMAWYV